MDKLFAYLIIDLHKDQWFEVDMKTFSFYLFVRILKRVLKLHRLREPEVQPELT